MRRDIRMLYIGGLTKGTTGYRKYLIFRSRVDKLSYFDSDPYKKKNSLITKLNHKGVLGSSKRKLNLDILAFVKGKKFDLIYFSKADWIFPNTLKELRSHSHLIVHYTPDAAFLYNYTPEFGKGAKLYDYLLTTKEWELPNYYNHTLAPQQVILTYQGVDTDFFKPKSFLKTEDLVFIGRKESHYQKVVEFLHSNSVDINVYGNQWLKNNYFFYRKKPYICGGNLFNEQYVDKIVSSKIGLGLLSKLFPETTTTRTFEITSCGTLLIAERTERHLELFNEDTEAVFFSSQEELLSKVQFYLKNDTIRERIANKGRVRCLNSGYSNDAIVSTVLKLINK